MHARSVASSSAFGKIRRPTATTVSAASTSAPGSFAATASAFSRAKRSAWTRGSSPLGTLSSTSAGITASGTTPMRARRSRRRGLAEASTRRIALLEAISDAALGQVVRGQFDQHFVAGQHADAVLAHLARGVAEDFVAILQLDAEHRIGQQLDHPSAHLEKFFLGHSNPYPPELSWRLIAAESYKEKRAENCSSARNCSACAG